MRFKEVCMDVKLTRGRLWWFVLCQIGSIGTTFPRIAVPIELAQRGIYMRFERQE